MSSRSITHDCSAFRLADENYYPTDQECHNMGVVRHEHCGEYLDLSLPCCECDTPSAATPCRCIEHTCSTDAREGGESALPTFSLAFIHLPFLFRASPPLTPPVKHTKTDTMRLGLTSLPALPRYITSVVAPVCPVPRQSYVDRPDALFHVKLSKREWHTLL